VARGTIRVDSPISPQQASKMGSTSRRRRSQRHSRRERRGSLSDFPLGSPESRAAARLQLLRVGVAGELPPDCICFPEKEQNSRSFIFHQRRKLRPK
jgi:hypothetical protein